MQAINSIQDITDAYDAFIIDLWGVMHDGTQLYAGASEALAYLAEQNKQVMFLSNAPRKAEKAVAGLDRFGIPKEHYGWLLTSGQAAYDMLIDSKEWGTHYYYLGPSKDEDILDGSGYTQTDDMQKADFILNAGFEVDFQDTDAILPTLEKLVSAELPLICVNPDMEVVKQDGTHMLCAGWVAARYEQMGGDVTYIGKPHAHVYGRCLKHFEGIEKERILAIGDNIATDILGAGHAGIDALLITGGIMKVAYDGIPSTEQAQAACSSAGVNPTYIATAFAK